MFSIDTRQTFEILKLHFKTGNEVMWIDKCSICNENYGFFWDDEQLMFDGTCNCEVQSSEEAEIRSDDDLMEFIEKNPDVIFKIMQEHHIYLN